MNRNAALLVTLALFAPSSFAVEGFDNVPALFSGGGWAQTNLSNPLNAPVPWGQGDSSQFAAASGPDDSYIAANYNATGDGSGAATDVGTISAWLFTPTATFSNGDHVQFMTRTGIFPLAPDPSFADRLQVRLSTNGASTDVGSTESSVGDFSTLLLDINPNLSPQGYPDGWTLYDVAISGLGGPTLGRIGFRYFVTDGGPGGTNSSLVALDSYNVQAVPEPASVAALGLSAVALVRRRRGVR